MKTLTPGRWQWMLGIALVLFALTYILAVLTYSGQLVENAALIGAKSITKDELEDARIDLNTITHVSLAVALILLVAIGRLRRSWPLTIAGPGILLGATVTTEVLKHFILPRPDLADTYPHNWHNSFPSGHTTIAMASLVALLVVIPYRWRGLVMLFTMTWAVSIGAATLTARWHRLSDTIGGDLMALIFGAGFAIWLAKKGVLSWDQARAKPLRVVGLLLFSVTVAAALISGTVLLILQLQSGENSEFNRNIFLASQSLAYGLSGAAALAFWATLHKIETVGGTKAAAVTQ